MNALGHLLDFLRTFSNSATENISVFLASEIYLQRLKRFLFKKVNLKWNEVLHFDYLNSINYWATLADLQKVIPFQRVQAIYLKHSNTIIMHSAT